MDILPSPIIDADHDHENNLSLLIIYQVVAIDGDLISCFNRHLNKTVTCKIAHSLLLEVSLSDFVFVLEHNNIFYISGILFSSSDQFRITTHRPITFSLPTLSFRASRLDFFSKSLSFESITANFRVLRFYFASKSVKLVSDYISNFSRIVISQFHHRISRTLSNDVLVAKQIHLNGTELIRQKSNLIQINSKTYVLIDGKRILLG